MAKAVVFDSRTSNLTLTNMETLDPDYTGSKQTFEEINEKIGSRIMTILYSFDGIDLFADDEGLFAPNLVHEVRHSEYPELNGQLQVAGNIVFLGHDDGGNSIPLTEEQINSIPEHFAFKLIGRTNVGI